MSLVSAAKGMGNDFFFFIGSSFHQATRWAGRRPAGLLHQCWPAGRGGCGERGDEAGFAASRFGRGSSPTTRNDRLIRRSIERNESFSDESQNEIAMPAFPARAVRPMRWT
jgi:hypothetical protein